MLKISLCNGSDLLWLFYIWGYFKWSRLQHVVNILFMCSISSQYTLTIALPHLLLTILAESLLSLLRSDWESRFLWVLRLRHCQAWPGSAHSYLCRSRITCEILLHLLIVSLRGWLSFNVRCSSIECVDWHHTVASLFRIRLRVLWIEWW